MNSSLLCSNTVDGLGPSLDIFNEARLTLFRRATAAGLKTVTPFNFVTDRQVPLADVKMTPAVEEPGGNPTAFASDSRLPACAHPINLPPSLFTHFGKMKTLPFLTTGHDFLHGTGTLPPPPAPRGNLLWTSRRQVVFATLLGPGRTAVRVTPVLAAGIPGLGLPLYVENMSAALVSVSTKPSTPTAPGPPKQTTPPYPNIHSNSIF